MRAVIQARYSLDSQREESIEGQLRDCLKYAKYNDIEIVGQYIDRAFSAKTDDRLDFQRMIADGPKKLFDVVLVNKCANALVREFFPRNGALENIFKKIFEKSQKNLQKILKRVLTNSEIHDIINIKMQATRVACASYRFRSHRKAEATQGDEKPFGTESGEQKDKRMRAEQKTCT